MSSGRAQGNRWISCLGEAPESTERILVGAIPGEGIGPEVVESALRVLRAVAGAASLSFEVREGGPIGRDGEREYGAALPDPTRDFCAEIFRGGGAVLCGPGGGRFVYELRRVFDLFFKISPLQVRNGLSDVSRIRRECLEGVDILLVRENCGGVYQGTASGGGDPTEEACHSFGYREKEVVRFLGPAARLAKSRSGRLTVVWKESGVPTISALWKHVGERVGAEAGIEVTLVDVDLMAYQLIQEPTTFDVIAAPNLFGDVLGDLGAVLLGSRGISYSGNFASEGSAVYQTNHGAAYDLAGRGRANPSGQILSLALMLRESFGRVRESEAIETGLRQAWEEGLRTDDVAEAGSRSLSTIPFTDAVVERSLAAWERQVSPAP